MSKEEKFFDELTRAERNKVYKMAVQSGEYEGSKHGFYDYVFRSNAVYDAKTLELLEIGGDARDTTPEERRNVFAIFSLETSSIKPSKMAKTVRNVNIVTKPRKRKPTAKQIAARKKFAAAAKSGALAKKRKAAKKKVAAAFPSTTKRKATKRKTTRKAKTPVVTAALKKKARKEGGIVVKKVRTQEGTSLRAVDKALTAKAPGWRISRTGKLYYEARKNRSDKPGQRI